MFNGENPSCKMCPFARACEKESDADPGGPRK